MSTKTTSFGKTPEAFQGASVPTRIRDQVPLYLGQRGNHFSHRPFAELHCVTTTVFFVAFTEELVQQAYELGYEAIAIADAVIRA